EDARRARRQDRRENHRRGDRDAGGIRCLPRPRHRSHSGLLHRPPAGRRAQRRRRGRRIARHAGSAADRMIVHLIDGTYELFRHFYGIRRFTKKDPPYGAVAGVLGTVAQMLEPGATHIAVATDHVIESFRNELWTGYKTGAGIEPALWRQFHPLEDALMSMGVTTWPMVELE